jgi:hypothetical protein
MGITTPYRKNRTWYETLHGVLNVNGFFGPTYGKENVYDFGKWSVSSLYRTVSLTTLASKVARYKLDLVAVQSARWDNTGSKPADDYIFDASFEPFTVTMFQMERGLWGCDAV